jgi:hypothetical protein
MDADEFSEAIVPGNTIITQQYHHNNLIRATLQQHHNNGAIRHNPNEHDRNHGRDHRTSECIGRRETGGRG